MTLLPAISKLASVAVITLYLVAVCSVKCEYDSDESFSMIEPESLSVSKVFAAFKAKHGKTYGSPKEENEAREKFKKNLKRVRDHNSGPESEDYKIGLNKYSDMTSEEMHEMLDGIKTVPDESEIKRRKGAPPKHPKIKHEGLGLGLVDDGRVKRQEASSWNLNYTAYGYTTPVVDQGQCGSCWAIAAAEALQAQYGVVNGVLPKLSAQNLLDCSGPYGNSGCGGGNTFRAHNYVRDNGMAYAYSYPYVATQGTCRYSQSMRVPHLCVVDYEFMPKGDENELVEGLFNQGPMAVAVNAEHYGFQNYKSGIYKNSYCSQTTNHAVLLVGYGTSSSGQKYWLLQNSWGTGWGERGYMRMARDNNNQCGIASFANYPVLEEC